MEASDPMEASGYPLRRVAGVLALFMLAGAAAGVVWERLWDAPKGLVFDGRWFLEPAGPDLGFQSVALYVLIAFVLGALLAVLSGLWPEHETATLVAVVIGSCAAGALMYLVGTELGPPDPQALAAGAKNYSEIDGSLTLNAPDQGRVPWHSTALVAFPAGAMTGLVATYLMGRGLRTRDRG